MPFPFLLSSSFLLSQFGLSKEDAISFSDIMQSPAVGEAPENERDDEGAVLIPHEVETRVRRGAYDV